MELMVPTSSLPWIEGQASRSALSATFPGIASKAIRAHEANCLSDKSLANSGTAAFDPWMASRLQVMAFSGSWCIGSQDFEQLTFNFCRFLRTIGSEECRSCRWICNCEVRQGE